jgi:hypothetical protein
MAQFHYVVYYDTTTGNWKVDLSTTVARFPDGTVYDGQEWTSVDKFQPQEETACRELGKLLWEASPM